MKIRYKRFTVLNITALVLLFVLLLESMMFVAVRLLFQQDLYVKAIALGMEIVILAMGIALFFGYKHLYHFLSYMDMGAIIITEILKAKECTCIIGNTILDSLVPNLANSGR